jgi:hypothetical protein
VPHSVEHFTIYVATGFAFGLGYKRRHDLLAILIVIFSGSIEVAQLSVPGRHARLSDLHDRCRRSMYWTTYGIARESSLQARRMITIFANRVRRRNVEVRMLPSMAKSEIFTEPSPLHSPVRWRDTFLRPINLIGSPTEALQYDLALASLYSLLEETTASFTFALSGIQSGLCWRTTPACPA